MDLAQPWWVHLIYAVVGGLAVAWLDYRARKVKSAVDDNTAKTEEVKATAKLTYQTVNGRGLLGEMRKVRQTQDDHEKKDDERFGRIERLLTGEGEQPNP